MISKNAMEIIFVLLILWITSSQQLDCGQTFNRRGELPKSNQINGQKTDIIYQPWMTVQMKKDKTTGKPILHCAGSLIHHEWILTSAHCVDGYDIYWNQTWVLLGANNITNEEEGERRSIKNVIIHDRYTIDRENRTRISYFDVALLHLNETVSTSIDYDYTIHPICLPEEPDPNQDNMIGRGITIPGYGSEKFQKENILRLLKMDMYPAKYCGSVHDVGEFDDEKEKIERALPRLFNLTTVICGGQRQFSEGLCRGDSGGPVMYDDILDLKITQIGIVQGGVVECINNKFPAVFVRTSDPSIFNFINWHVFGKTPKPTGNLPIRQCFTTNDSPDKNVQCQLPFKFNGILRQECITDTDPDDRHWCSTKIDENLEHIPGNGYWGYCDQSCPPLFSKETKEEFTCPEGYKIPSQLKCDGFEHCSDGSDERSCTEHICPEGYQIPFELKCDGFLHCSDGSDEEDCPKKAVDCEWSEWSSCSQTCGPAQASRSILISAEHGGQNCTGARSRYCNAEKCPVNCEWSQWSGCSKTCGPGWQTRSFLVPAENGGQNCTGSKSRRCNAEKCPVDCEWSQWSGCSKTCGPGQQTRSFLVPAENGGQNCTGSKSRSCNLEVCPYDVCETLEVDLENLPLSSQRPFKGTYQQSRKVNGDQSWSSNGNQNAIWFDSEKNIWLIGRGENIGGDTGSFYARRIPGSGPDNDANLWNYLSGGWQIDNEKDISVRCTDLDCQWSQWSTCSKTCGSGQQERFVQVSAKQGGQQCTGSRIKDCNLENCPRVTPTARSLVPRGLSSVKVFPPFDPPARTFRATGVIFSEASGSNYGFIVVVTFETECRECDQIITGRDFAYRNALAIIQNEDYVDFIDFDEIRKKRDIEVKNSKKYAQLLGSNKKSRTKRQTGDGFLSAAPAECSIIPRCN